jgi:nitroreductase
MHGYQFIPYASYREYPEPEMRRRAAEFCADMHRRRTIRDFDTRAVPREIIADCIRAAGSAPSGANQQPWHFVACSDPGTKSVLRVRVEEAEREFYGGVAPQEWLNALGPIGTDEHKPYIERAPWVIAVFAQLYGAGPAGEKTKHYYVQESVGIACGILITALHNAGLATLTHTPSPMGFMSELFKRPANERAVMLIVTGYPAADATVPDIKRKALNEFAEFIEG